MDELKQALATIERLASDPKARIFGLSEPLRCLARLHVQIQADQAALATAILKMHYWPGDPLTVEQFENMVRIKGGL